VAIGTVAVAALAYRLIDVFLLLFIGIAVAAALQPSHVKLCRWGVPKGLAVLLIYLLFSIGLALIVDAMDQQIDEAGAQVERIISAAEETSEPLAAKERAAMVGKLEGATEDVEQAVERVETVIAANADSQAPLDDLERATQHFEDAVHDASTNGACQERPLSLQPRRKPRPPPQRPRKSKLRTNC
jgi:predicted PurR-regulated permease PerM